MIVDELIEALRTGIKEHKISSDSNVILSIATDDRDVEAHLTEYGTHIGPDGVNMVMYAEENI